LTGVAMLAAGVLHVGRLARWAGDRTLRDRLVLVLHVGYAFVPLGFLLIGTSALWAAVPPSAGIHAWTAGAVGLMTLAVMTRATLGHTGRALAASPATQAIYALALLAALLRIAAAFLDGDIVLLHLSAAAWIAAFAGFVLVYGPMLIARPPAWQDARAERVWATVGRRDGRPATMPLQNRVTPSGELIADPARGLFMGNRGGRIHDARRTLGARRWASKQWICCRLEFNDRQRSVWGEGYTELFFLDEPTALAAGHRPCFECRRKHAEAFAAFWQRAQRMGVRPRAAAMDDVLHAERLDGRNKRRHCRKIDGLPDGAFVVSNGAAFAVRGDALLRWTTAGYDLRKSRPRAATVDVLTPPSILAVLSAGYRPQWHPSVENLIPASPP
jgi:hypothetical protein